MTIDFTAGFLVGFGVGSTLTAAAFVLFARRVLKGLIATVSVEVVGPDPDDD